MISCSGTFFSCLKLRTKDTSQQNMILHEWWRWFISSIALHQSMLLALYNCWNINLYTVFFTHTNTHKAAIVGTSTISITLNFYTHWGGRDLYFKSIDLPGWFEPMFPEFGVQRLRPLRHHVTKWESWIIVYLIRLALCFSKSLNTDVDRSLHIIVP